jgi:AcrR family transcriptional regulator
MTSAPAPIRRRLRPEDRRRQILAAAADLFGARGYDGGSVDAIGARIGISGAAIYRHFARKQDILVALLDQAVSRALIDLEAVQQSAEAPEARLALFTAQLVRHAESGRGLLQLIHAGSAELDAGDRAQVKAIGDRLIAPWAAAIRAARPALAPAAAELRVRACFAVLGGLANSFPSAFGDDRQAELRHLLLAMLQA